MSNPLTNKDTYIGHTYNLNFIYALGVFSEQCFLFCILVGSSAPSTPSVRSNTPVSKTTKVRSKGRPKGSPRVRTSVSMKKALNAAEIAGTNAAYAAVGITPTNNKGE